MRLRDLECALCDVKTFESPVPELEQYPTSPHLAAQVVHTMHSNFDDIEGSAVCDLGCGTGMLSIAAALSGANYVLGIDVDPTAVATASQNAQEIEVIDTVDFCIGDITDGHFLASQTHGKKFDTVIMNPPFGTKRKGVDVLFLQAAVQLSRNALYSMHKTSTREYILRKAKQWGADAKVVANLKFDVARMYQFHKANTVDVEVDFWRLDVSKVSNDIVFDSSCAPLSQNFLKHTGGRSSHARGGKRARGARSKRGGRL